LSNPLMKCPKYKAPSLDVSVAVHEGGCANTDVIGPRLNEAMRFWSVMRLFEDNELRAMVSRVKDGRFKKSPLAAHGE
jgi:hypothetical protein